MAVPQDLEPPLVASAPLVALGSVKAVLAEIVEAAVVVEEAVEAVAAT